MRLNCSKMSIATLVSALMVCVAVQVGASGNGTVSRQETIYGKFVIDEGVELQNFTEPVYSKLQCAIKCLVEKGGCPGFQSSSEYPCQLLQCLNKNLYNLSTNDVSGRKTAHLKYNLATNDVSGRKTVHLLYNLSTNDVSGKTVHLKYKHEVETDLARGKPASQSTTRLGHVATDAVDGIYIPAGSEQDSLTHTLPESQPWWRVDLEDVYCIWAVKILFRIINWHKVKNVVITVADTEEQIFYTAGEESNLCTYHDGSLDQYYTLMTCRKAIRGQFVQILLLNANRALNMHEVEVHGL